MSRCHISRSHIWSATPCQSVAYHRRRDKGDGHLCEVATTGTPRMLCDLGGVLGRDLSVFLECGPSHSGVEPAARRTRADTFTRARAPRGAGVRWLPRPPELVQRPWVEVCLCVCGHGGRAVGPRARRVTRKLCRCAGVRLEGCPAALPQAAVARTGDRSPFASRCDGDSGALRSTACGGGVPAASAGQEPHI